MIHFTTGVQEQLPTPATRGCRLLHILKHPFAQLITLIDESFRLGLRNHGHSRAILLKGLNGFVISVINNTGIIPINEELHVDPFLYWFLHPNTIEMLKSSTFGFRL